MTKKSWKNSILIKIVLWLLLIASAFGFAYSGKQLLESYSYNLFSKDPAEIFYSTHMQNTARDYADSIVRDVFVDDVFDANRLKTYSTDNCNLAIQIVDLDGEELGVNYKLLKKPEQVALDVFIESEERHTYETTAHVFYEINQKLPAHDIISEKYEYAYNLMVHQKAYVSMIWSSLLGILALSVLMCISAGHRKEEDIHMMIYDHLPYELVLAVFITLIVMSAMETLELYGAYDGQLYVPVMISLVAGAIILCEYTLMTTVRRIKVHMLVKTTLIYFCLKWIGIGFGMFFSMFRYIPMMLRPIVLYLAAWLWAVLASNRYFRFSYFLLMMTGLAVLIYDSYCRSLIRKAEQHIVDGDIEVVIDKRYMLPMYRKHAVEVELIRDSISAAVQKQMRSERMRTELITNVSHDIKTPLTSVINYVDLLRKEEDEEKRQEYLEVLNRNALRLKQLTTDIVEASRASTGNIEVHAENMAFDELIVQALAEFDAKLEQAMIEPVFRVPDEPVMIHADGRLLWRIMSNLLSNAVKYGQPGTRVYIDVEAVEDRALMTMRNISRDALNISADELKQRFVRGDASRHSEGSGLGLDIASSLASLMGGNLRIEIDGDLFKVFVSMPLSTEIPEAVTAVNE